MSGVKSLPPSWSRVEFDDAVDAVSDRGYRIKQKDYLLAGNVPVIDQGEGLIGGFTNDIAAKVVAEKPVIVFGDHTRRFKYVDFAFAVGADGVKLFTATDLWDAKFLYLQLGTVDLEDRGYGRHYQHLRKASLNLPPRPEQVRIVARLEELLSDLDVGVAELRAAQKKLTRYRQSLLKAAVEGVLTAAWRKHNKPKETGAHLLERILRERRARWEEKQLAKFKEQGKAPPPNWQRTYPEPVKPDVTDLPELPEGWVWASLDQLVALIRNGLSHKPTTEPNGYPILRINAVRPLQVDLSEVRYLSIDDAEASGYLLEEGDLLATRYNGSVDLLGVVGVVRGLSRPTLHPDKLIRIKPVLSHCLGDWMEICAAVGESRRHIVSRVKTTAGQTGISGDDVKKMPIPLPPLGEQMLAAEAIATALRESAAQGNLIETSIARSLAQRKNILKAAFAGQLVAQDPNDEPASMLLERIRAERLAKAQSTTRRAVRKRA